ncbi:hypothetical protein V8F33_007042 [Rhypophila sp. PSN 637]
MWKWNQWMLCSSFSGSSDPAIQLSIVFSFAGRPAHGEFTANISCQAGIIHYQQPPTCGTGQRPGGTDTRLPGIASSRRIRFPALQYSILGIPRIKKCLQNGLDSWILVGNWEFTASERICESLSQPSSVLAAMGAQLAYPPLTNETPAPTAAELNRATWPTSVCHSCWANKDLAGAQKALLLHESTARRAGPLSIMDEEAKGPIKSKEQVPCHDARAGLSEMATPDQKTYTQEGHWRWLHHVCKPTLNPAATDFR